MIQFREVLEGDAELTLKWRTNPRVSQQMATEFSGDLSTQRIWIDQAYQRSNYYHWIFECADEPIGLVSLSNIDMSDRTAFWGIYVGEDSAQGYGLIATIAFYNCIFAQFELSRLYAEVLDSNEMVSRMHEKMGYVRLSCMDRTENDTHGSKQLRVWGLSREVWSSRVSNRGHSSLPVSRWLSNPFEQLR